MLDASLLLMPLIGFISPDGPDVAVHAATRWTGTLVSDSLVYRYDPSASPDGLPGLRGHVLAVHVLVRATRSPAPDGWTRPA